MIFIEWQVIVLNPMMREGRMMYLDARRSNNAPDAEFCCGVEDVEGNRAVGDKGASGRKCVRVGYRTEVDYCVGAVQHVENLSGVGEVGADVIVQVAATDDVDAEDVISLLFDVLNDKPAHIPFRASDDNSAW